ncbi:pilus assembly protein CpaD [Azospirillum brasilense]|uniref:Pilus assembly protein CpaD n=2 Tax=Azospirillum brasilense TaxID=192 RepID=A0A560B141_AZOBR|nr:pilus assembly protein CpaD [Azospirillum brasilense]
MTPFAEHSAMTRATPPRAMRTPMLLLPLLTGLLGGCAVPQTPPSMPVAQTPAVKALSNAVPFAIDPRSGAITAQERDRVVRTVAGLGRDTTPHVTVTGPLLAAPAQAAAVSLLGGAGVPVENVTFAPDQTGAPALQVTSYVALAPDCQAWSDIYSGWYQNSPTAALGCSNQRNLALMLADPRDLVQGRETAPADGQRMAGAVQRYRADKVKPFVKGNTSSAFLLAPALNGSQEDQ